MAKDDKKNEVAKVVTELLTRMGIVFELEVSEVAGQTMFTIRTKDSGVLIGTGGENLHALNHVVKKIFEGKDEGRDENAEALHFIVDVNDYHRKYISELEGQAKMLAERARTFKYNVEMSPMSSYERLIVHAALQGAPEIKTESAGEGPTRHVVIKYVAPL